MRASRWRAILYGVESWDPIVYLTIILTLTVTGLLVTFLPARAATRTDPMEALRNS